MSDAVKVLDDLASKLETLDRGPFRGVLQVLLGVQPTREALETFANKAPDRWAQALAVIGALAGYERGALFQVNLFDVKRLSDAELLAEARRHGVPIDVTPLAETVIPPAPPAGESRQLEVSVDVSPPRRRRARRPAAGAPGKE